GDALRLLTRTSNTWGIIKPTTDAAIVTTSPRYNRGRMGSMIRHKRAMACCMVAASYRPDRLNVEQLLLGHRTARAEQSEAITLVLRCEACFSATGMNDEVVGTGQCVFSSGDTAISASIPVRL